MKFDAHANACKVGTFDSLTSRLLQSDDPEIDKRERKISRSLGKLLGYGKTDLYSLRPINPVEEYNKRVKNHGTK